MACLSHPDVQVSVSAWCMPGIPDCLIPATQVRLNLMCRELPERLGDLAMVTALYTSCPRHSGDSCAHHCWTFRFGYPGEHGFRSILLHVQTSITHEEMQRKLSKNHSVENIQISSSQIFYNINMRITISLIGVIHQMQIFLEQVTILVISHFCFQMACIVISALCTSPKWLRFDFVWASNTVWGISGTIFVERQVSEPESLSNLLLSGRILQKINNNIAQAS